LLQVFRVALHHPVVGDLSLSFETMTLTGDSNLTVFAYTAEPAQNPRKH
jgi:hypothetical protein